MKLINTEAPGYQAIYVIRALNLCDAVFPSGAGHLALAISISYSLTTVAYFR